MRAPFAIPRRLALFFAIAAVSAPAVHAETRTWVSNAGSSLPTGARWSGGVAPTTSDEAVFSTLVPPALLTTGNTLTWGNLVWNTAGSSTIQLGDGASGNRIFTLSGGGGSSAAIAAGGATGDLIVMGTESAGQTLTISNQPNSSSFTLILALGASGNFNVVNANSSLVISSALQGNFDLTKTGAGTLTLSGANTFGNGNTFTLSEGRLNINSTNALGSAAAGSTFVINGGSIDNTSGSAVTTNGKTQVWNANVNFIGTNNLTLASTANVSLGTTAGSSRTVTVQANTLRVNGVIANGTTANSLVKDGTGTLLLMGNNTYTGTTTVSGGTLGGEGSIGAVVVANGGTLAPGVNLGTFVTGSVSVLTGGTLAIDINTSTLASDLLMAGGNLSLESGSILTLSDLGANVALDIGTTFTFIEYSGSWTGGFFTFNGSELADNATFNFGANDYRISYNGVDGFTSAVTLTVVPEPSTAAVLLVAGLGALVVFRRTFRRA